VAEDEECVATAQRIREAALATEKRAQGLREQFVRLAYLWTTPLQASLQVRALLP
jgi:hypothetical protein